MVVPLIGGNICQDRQWMPETVVVPKPIYTMFSLHIFMIKFNLQVRHNKRLITISNNKTEQLQRYIVIKVT